MTLRWREWISVGVSIEFVPGDAWIGAYFRRRAIKVGRWDQGWQNGREVYICLFPFVPIHLWIEWRTTTAAVPR